jgi:hypothetical protein
MIRTTLQAALCFCLSPLLAAQQVQAQTPQGTQLSVPPLPVTTFDQPAYLVGLDGSIIRLEAAEGTTFAAASPCCAQAIRRPEQSRR